MTENISMQRQILIKALKGTVNSKEEKCKEIHSSICQSPTVKSQRLRGNHEEARQKKKKKSHKYDWKI